MPLNSDAEAIRRRVAGWRAAEQRALDELKNAPILDPETSLRTAQELCELLPFRHEDDALRVREVELARKTWAKLRARMACPPSPTQR